MPSLEQKLEAMLFTAAKPLSVKRLSELCAVKPDKVKEALDGFAARLDQTSSALQVVVHGNEAELVTRGEVAEAVRETVKDETSGELTRPSLEALAILAYRGPLTRPELEQIRGVQSALILRNLMLRGLVEMREDTRLGQPIYAVTLDFLKHLGAARLESLPDYAALHVQRAVDQVLEELNEPKKSGEQKVKI